MKIAIASSGLGHVARGIEAWARDTAHALHEAGADVTLFCSGDVQMTDDRGRRTEGEQGRAPNESTNQRINACPPKPWRRRESTNHDDLRVVVMPCCKRTDLAARFLARLSPGFTWRWYLKSPYGWEQFSFWRRLWRVLDREQFDVLHVQGPMLAYWCRDYREKGRLRTREILGHATEEPIEFLAPFPYVQHLTPWHLENALAQLAAAQKAEGGRTNSEVGKHSGNESTNERINELSSSPPFWVTLPNFIDTQVFRPAGLGPKDAKTEMREERRRIGIPEDAFVVGTAAAVKARHKRVDHLVEEFAVFTRMADGEMVAGRKRAEAGGRNVHLLIAGARTDETDFIKELAEKTLPGRVTFLLNAPRETMPDVYRCMDAFVLPSRFEMMPIALLEAGASGLPIITHDHPSLRWIVGDAQNAVDMEQGGDLAAMFKTLLSDPALVQRQGEQARKYAVRHFDKKIVIQRYLAYYHRVVGDGKG